MGSFGRNLLFTVFFLSGFSGLIYESVWSHYIKLIAGHAAYAQTAVLAIFMGGLALGSWIIGKRSRKVANPLLWYAIIEGIVGVFGILFHKEFLLFHHLLFDVIAASGISGGAFESIKWLITIVLLLPQAILLGMTFPLMSAAIIRVVPENSGYVLGMLYFCNSIGAALGVLFSGFVLIEFAGLPGTALIAGIINVFLATVAWLISNRMPLDEPEKQSSSKGSSTKLTKLVVVMISVAFFTGFSSFFYEIAWIRMLSLVLGSSIQAFELMLAAFITGLALGSYFIRNRIDRIKRPNVFLAYIQILMGILAMATLPLYIDAFDIMAFAQNALTRTDSGYLMFNLISQFIAFLIMLPATFMAGMTLPLITNILIKTDEGESAIGKVYAFNTFGAIIGVLIASHWLMPGVGLKGLILSGSLIDLLAGVLILLLLSQITQWQKGVVVASFFVIFIFAQTPFSNAVLSSGIYRTGQATTVNDDDVVYYQDGKTATVSVIRRDDSVAILTNGKPDASIHYNKGKYSEDEVTMAMLAGLPLIYSDAKNVANIGFGSGLTSHLLLESETLERLDTIEIESAIVEGAKLFGDKVSNTYSDSRSNIIIDDAKSYFAGTHSVYDVIVSEPSNPWVNGVASLYTQEFYANIKKHLSEDGLLVQWFHLYENDKQNLSSVLNALSLEFRFLKFYFTNSFDVIVLASNTEFKGNDELKLAFEKHQKVFKSAGLNSLSDLSIRKLGDEQRLAALGLIQKEQGIVNSDYYPYLAYHAPKTFFKKTQVNDVASLMSHYLPVLRWLDGTKDIGNLSSPEGVDFRFNLLRDEALAFVNGQPVKNERLKYARALMNSCASQDEFLILENMFAIAVGLNSYLERDQLSQYWKTLEQCIETSGSELLNLWHGLFSASAQMDSFEVIRLTGIVYDEGVISIVEPNLKNYVFAIRLTSLLATNKINEAEAFIRSQDSLEETLKDPINLLLVNTLILRTNPI